MNEIVRCMACKRPLHAEKSRLIGLGGSCRSKHKRWAYQILLEKAGQMVFSFLDQSKRLKKED